KRVSREGKPFFKSGMTTIGYLTWNSSGISLMRNGIDDRTIQKFCLPEQENANGDAAVLVGFSSVVHE
ncbi:hypothetical protein CEXT_33731, partial [Caerostris extrusa]